MAAFRALFQAVEYRKPQHDNLNADQSSSSVDFGGVDSLGRAV
jgi:hypothetical protein